MRQSSPPWLQTGYGKSFVEGLGDGLDELLSDHKDAIKGRFPTYAAGNSDNYALALIGDDSSLPRYPSETDVEYGDRLQARWERYERAGAAERLDGSGCPIVEDAEGIGFGGVVLMEYRDWPADAVDPNVHHSPGQWYDQAGILGIMILGFDVLGSPWWSRFWLYVESFGGADIPSGGVMGVGVLGTMVLGADVDTEAVSGVVRSVLTWKPAHIRCESLIVLTDGTPIESVLGVGLLGTMVLGAAGAGPGSVAIDIRR